MNGFRPGAASRRRTPGIAAFCGSSARSSPGCPKTRGILFTIRTYRNPVSEVVADPDRLRRFTAVVKGIPRATREYKGMASFADALIDYLESRCRKQSGAPASTVPGQREERPVEHKREPIMGNIAYSNVHTSLWEPMPIDTPDLLEGDPVPKVHWLRKNEKGDPTYLTGLWWVQPATFRWLFFGHETFHVLEGRASSRPTTARPWRSRPATSSRSRSTRRRCGKSKSR